MGAGFVLGVRKPCKPGARAETWEEIGVRVRRLLSEHRSNPERKVLVRIASRKLLARAKAEGIYSGGRFSERGKAVLLAADRAKAMILAELEQQPTIRHDELLANIDPGGRTKCGRWRRRGTTEGVRRFNGNAEPAPSQYALEAAVMDLEDEGKVRLVFEQCPDCSRNHLALTRGMRWDAKTA